MRRIGRTYSPFHPPSELKECEMWLRLKELMPQCSKYGWPDRSHLAELKSFLFTASRNKKGIEPDWRSFFPALEKKYLRFTNPVYLEEFNVERLDMAIESMIPFLNKKASPGMPYALMSLTNKGLLEQKKEWLKSHIIERIRALSEVDLSELSNLSAKELVERGLADPVRVFVKNEPHKVEKLEAGRVRLIFSVSIADKMIQMLMRKHIHELEIRNWSKIPSKPGIGFDKEKVALTYKKVMSMDNAYDSDLQTFDWSYQPWFKEADVEFKIRMCNNPSKFWKHLMHASRLALNKPVYMTSDGSLFDTSLVGIMNSGEFLTGNCNSFVRVLCAHIIGADDAIAMGDDCVESYAPEAKARYAMLGLTLKQYNKVEDGFEFCSRWYVEGNSWLINVEKVLMNCVHVKLSDKARFMEAVSALESDLGTHPNYDRFLELLEKIGFFSIHQFEEIRVEDSNFHGSDCLATKNKSTTPTKSNGCSTTSPAVSNSEDYTAAPASDYLREWSC